jgi:hypothetical protein
MRCLPRPGHGSGSIAEKFARCGVTFFPSRKADRITDWHQMKNLAATRIHQEFIINS